MGRMDMVDVTETWFEDWKIHFGEVPDPRVQKRKLHPLMDVLMLGLCAIISGAEGWVEVAAYGKARHDWLKQFLDLPHGIPSHDTIGRIFSIINPNIFQECFVRWARSLAKENEGLISIDGKALRASNDKGDLPKYIVSAWSASNQLVLGQVKTEEKSNEITAMPNLIDAIDVSGSIVSIDAAGCQKSIAKKIIDSGGDYLLALKGNQGNLHKEVSEFLESIHDQNVYDKKIDRSESFGKGHGRLEKRVCLTSSNTELMPTTREWPSLKTVIIIESQRVMHDESSIERRFYISSQKKSAQEFNDLIRGHWGIENSLHWILDVAFKEDQCRVRSGYAAENYATLRHIGLNLLKQDKSKKIGIKAKRMRAAWDPDYLLSILRGI